MVTNRWCGIIEPSGLLVDRVEWSVFIPTFYVQVSLIRQQVETISYIDIILCPVEQICILKFEVNFEIIACGWHVKNSKEIPRDTPADNTLCHKAVHCRIFLQIHIEQRLLPSSSVKKHSRLVAHDVVSLAECLVLFGGTQRTTVKLKFYKKHQLILHLARYFCVFTCTACVMERLRSIYSI